MKRFIPVGLALALFGLASPAMATTGGGLPKVDLLQRSVEAAPENLNLRYYLGSALLEDGFFPEAIEELRRAYPAYVDSKEMNYTLAIACYQVGDLDSSLLYLGQAEDLGALQEPETYSVVTLYYNIALKYVERSLFQEAEQAFLRVLQLDAGRLQVHRSLGDLYNRMGDTDRSLAEFEQYYKLFPEDGEIQQYLYATYLNRGLALLSEGDTIQAGILFDQAMAMTRENALAAYFKGYLAYKEGHYSLAARTLLTVLPALPEDARNNTTPILYNCALELAKNDPTRQEALDIIVPLIAGDSPLEKDLFLAGNIHMKLGQYELALALFEKILIQNPAHQGALLNLLVAQGKVVEQLTGNAQRFLKTERIIEAQQAVEAALRIDPSHKKAGLLKEKVLLTRDQFANKLLGEAEKNLAQGALPEALRQAREALTMSPDLAAGSELQEKILAALGQEIAGRLSQGQVYLAAQEVASATAAFNAVLALDPSNAQALDALDQLAAILQGQAKERAGQGRFALEQGDPAAAVVAFTEALQMVPDMQVAKEGLETAHARIETLVKRKILAAKDALSKGGYGEALRQLQGARDLRDTPLVQQEIELAQKALASHVAELLASADQALSRDELKRATSLCRKILEIDPDNSEVKTRLAALNQTTAAAVAGYLRQAREAMQAKTFNRALAAYKKILDLDPANGEAMQGLRDWEEKAGQHLANLEARAEEALAKGNYAQSEQLFKEVLALAPGRAKAHGGIKKLGQLRGEGLKPGDEEQLYLEGIALYTQGRYGEAVAIWKKVQLLAPGHVKAGLNVEKALRKLQSIKERRDA